MARYITLNDAAKAFDGDKSALLGALDAGLTGALLVFAPLTKGLSLSLFDPKNDVVTYLDKCRRSVRDRLSGASRLRRSEVVSAAFAIAVAAAFFDELSRVRELAGIRLTRQEQVRIVAGARGEVSRRLVEEFARIDLPWPDQSIPYSNFRESLSDSYLGMSERLLSFISGLAVWDTLNEGQISQLSACLKVEIPQRAAARCESYLLELSAIAPEVIFWTNLHQHAATQLQIEKLNENTQRTLASLRQIMSESRTGLLSVSKALNALSGTTRATASWQQLSERYVSVFNERLIDPEDQFLAGDFVIPRLADIYLPPAFRLIRSTDSARPSENGWWNIVTESRDDLDEFLAGFLTSVEATESPLLVLGHPGAGKSVLMKALASRLSTSGFRVVRVDLRHVPADAPIRLQLEYALREALSRSIEWGDLVDTEDEATPVVLLDGFDELLLSSATSRSDYIEQVKEFQRNERLRGRPTIAIVTSRTVVANRARIPTGSLVMRLEPFDPDRIELWLYEWASANRHIAAEHPELLLTSESALQHSHIAEQPLLLLMLAIYVAGGNSLPAESLGGSSGNGEVYEKILTAFAKREVRKTERHLDDDALSRRQEEELDQLAFAAFSMFNRGVQYVSETDLDKDLAVLAPAPISREFDGLGQPATVAQALVGRFFFVHVSRSSQGVTGEHRIRSYEFLHATFGEYLVARLTAKTLRHLVQVAEFRRASPSAMKTGLNDQLLAAMLSFQILAQRQQIVEFLVEIFAGFPAADRLTLRSTLNEIFGASFWRTGGGDYERYHPLAIDISARLAVYTANLITLMSALGGFHFREVVPKASDVHQAWSSLARFWQSRLGVESWASLRNCLSVTSDEDYPEIAIGIQDAMAFDAPSRGKIEEIAKSNYLVSDAGLAALLTAIAPLAAVTNTFFDEDEDGNSPARMLLGIVTPFDARDQDTADGDLVEQYLAAIKASRVISWESQHDRYLTWIIKQFVHEDRGLNQPQATLDVLRTAVPIVRGVVSMTYLIEAGVRGARIGHPASGEIETIVRKLAHKVDGKSANNLSPRRRIQLGLLLEEVGGDIPQQLRLHAALMELRRLRENPSDSDLIAQVYSRVAKHRLMQWCQSSGFSFLAQLPFEILAKIEQSDLRYVLASVTGTVPSDEINAMRTRWKRARQECGYPEPRFGLIS